MTCHSKESLALYAGGDLSGAEADRVSLHLQQCSECRRFVEGLAHQQALFRSVRQEAVAPAALAQMRRQLSSRLAEARPGWLVRVERFFLLELQRPRYAAAVAALVLVISATVFAQLRHVAAKPADLAGVIEDGSILSLPKGYQDWVLVGRSSHWAHAGAKGDDVQNVYMNPIAYREYRRTGSFPEGAVMVLQPAAPAGTATLVASVKDRRSADGWSYFRFDAVSGQVARKASALPESEGCVACHRERAAKDHVFTQFYPSLRSGAGVL